MDRYFKMLNISDDRYTILLHAAAHDLQQDVYFENLNDKKDLAGKVDELLNKLEGDVSQKTQPSPKVDNTLLVGRDYSVDDKGNITEL